MRTNNSLIHQHSTTAASLGIKPQSQLIAEELKPSSVYENQIIQ